MEIIFNKDEALNALSALAHDRRIDVFKLLVEAGPDGLAAGDIAKRLQIPHNTLSSQLTILSNARLIVSKRNGRSIIYSLASGGIQSLLFYLTEDCCGGDPLICSLFPTQEKPND